jgi:hypothetical protein
MRSAELVRVAQPIACCVEIGRVGGRGKVGERRMRPPAIVVIDPVGDICSGVIEIEEQGLVEKLGLRQQAHQFST